MQPYYRRKVEELNTEALFWGEIPFDISKNDTWFTSVVCEGCGKETLAEQKIGVQVKTSCCQILHEGQRSPSESAGFGYLLPDPLPFNISIEYAASQLHHLPLRLVAPSSGLVHIIVPTQSHLPLNREIAEAYMRLGVLPPLNTIDFTGEIDGRFDYKLARWLLAGAGESNRKASKILDVTKKKNLALKSRLGRS